MRPLTFAARTAEALFPLVLVGLCGRAVRTSRVIVPSRRDAIARVALVVVFASSTLVVALTGEPRLLPVSSQSAAAVVWAAVFLLAWWNGDGARWLFDRRIWAVAAGGLLLGMWATMNIGWFHPAVLACLLLLLDGDEVGRAIDRMRRAMGRPAAPPCPQRRTTALAYGPRRRALLSILLGWHLFALAVAILPASPHLDPVRAPLRGIVGPWLHATRTVQHWGMWAPDPRLENPELQIFVVHADGRRVRVDLHGRPHATATKPSVGYDRGHKIASVLLSSKPEQPHRRALARWLCRRPSLQRGGRPPQGIELHERVTAIPPPGAAAARPSTEHLLLSVPCVSE